MADKLTWVTFRDTDVLVRHDGYGLFNSLTMDGDFWVLDLNAANTTSGASFDRGLTFVLNNRLTDWGYAETVATGTNIAGPLLLVEVYRDVSWTSATHCLAGIFQYTDWIDGNNPSFWGGGYWDSGSVRCMIGSFATIGPAGGGMPAGFDLPAHTVMVGFPNPTGGTVDASYASRVIVATTAQSNVGDASTQSFTFQSYGASGLTMAPNRALSVYPAIHVGYSANIAVPQQIRFRVRMATADPYLLWGGL